MMLSYNQGNKVQQIKNLLKAWKYQDLYIFMYYLMVTKLPEEFRTDQKIMWDLYSEV